LVDLDSGPIDFIRSSSCGQLFRPDNVICGHAGAGNNWAVGYYTEGAELIDSVMDIVRREAESCDYLQGFQLTHSLGGGTGSGMGSRLVEKIQQEYYRTMSTYSVIPSPKMSDVVVEPYNVTLSMTALFNSADLCFILDNEALHNICCNTLQLTTPTYKDLNQLVSVAMCGTTCSFRFPTQSNSDLLTLAMNLTPCYTLKFLTIGIAPLSSLFHQSRPSSVLTVPELIQEQFDPKNMLSTTNPRRGKYLAAACLFRGNVSPREVEEQTLNIINKHSEHFIPSIPSIIKTSICSVPPKGLEMSSTLIGNTTATIEMFKRVANQFDRLYKGKAFVHRYTSEGISDSEFREALAILQQNIIYKYQYYQEEEENEEEEEEEEEEEGEDTN
jgi:tubulin beta